MSHIKYVTAHLPALTRNLIAAAGVIAVLAALSASNGSVASTRAVDPATIRPAAAAACPLSAILVPSCGRVLTGAWVNPDPGTSTASAFSSFKTVTASPMRIAHLYKRGSVTFPSASDKQILAGSAIFFCNWKVAPDKTWRQIANGGADAAIDAEAAYLKANFTKKMFLTIHHEPENEVNPAAGSGFRAVDYRDMYQHVVTRLRAQGVTNLVFVMEYMGAQKWASESWFPTLWPGASFVDWIAYAGYAGTHLGRQTGGFTDMMRLHYGTSSWRGGYAWAADAHPHKPQMLAEMGVAERAGYPLWKKEWFDSVGPALASFPRLKAIVYFNSVPPDAGDVRVNTSKPALTGYRAMTQVPAISWN